MIREAGVADATAIARVHVESWRTTYRGLVPDDLLASLSVERREQFWTETLSGTNGPGFAYVAEDAPGAVIGFASAGPEREGDPVYTGELHAIYLLEAAQRRGIGRRLMRVVAERLAEARHEAMLVWVAAENPFRHFYGALGRVPIREKEVPIAGATLTEVAYGWEDTRPLRRLDTGG